MYQINDLVIAKVYEVKPYALFLEIEDGTKGLLHISELSDSYIRDIEKFGTIGDEMKIKIIDIDSHNGFLRFSLKQVPEDERYSSHVEENKNFILPGEESFKSLEENLPTWIEETLQKIKKG